MTITFVCRSSKVSKKDGLTPLELYVIIDGKRRFVSLKRRIDHKLFNPKKQIIRGDTQTNKYIEAVRMKCYSLETEMLKRSLWSSAKKRPESPGGPAMTGQDDAYLVLVPARSQGRDLGWGLG